MKIFLLLVLSGGAICKQQSDDVLELIEQNGFIGEVYNVQTEDGYILRLHRVLPRGKPVQKLPVFLMHGMLVYSSVFILSAPASSLGFLLADAGYDVWMGNTRGTKYSMNHTTLSTESSEFWTFSFHEMGFYDLPAMIDLMLEKTSARKFFYIGHSQGSSSMMVLLSMRPEYNEKVAQVHLAAPAAFTNHIKQPFIETLFVLAKDGFFGHYRYLNMQPGWELLQELFCSQPPGSIQFAICEASALIVAGPNKRKIQIDRKAMQRYLHYMSPRLAVMQLIHYIQIHYSKKFQSFDYSWKNFEKDNSSKIIEYNLSKVTAPTFLYAGDVDAVVSVEDTVTLKGLLPNVKKFQVVDDWNHYDFHFAKDATLYKMFIEEMEAEKEAESNYV